MSEEMKDELNLQEPQPEVKEEVVEKEPQQQVEQTPKEEPVETKEDEIEEVKTEEAEQQPCAKCGKLECECEKEDKVKEEVKEEPKSEEEKEEEKVEEKEEKPEEVEPDKEDLEPERDQIKEDLIAELEELKAEKEEREALESCNKEVVRVEQEFTTCTERIAQALKDSFAQNGIDITKSLDDLRKEDPAKATLAEQFIRQATELRTQLEDAAMKEITKHQNNVIYKAASREFEKMGLNMEQAKEAVATFKRIANEVGIVDLKEDLQMKVQLAAGRAKMLYPVTEGVVDTTKIEEPNPEKEPAVEIKKEEPIEEVPPTPVVEKPKVEDFEEGVVGNSSANAGTLINELNVLEELAKLPYRERARFYKEHEDVITKVLSKRG